MKVLFQSLTIAVLACAPAIALPDALTQLGSAAGSEAATVAPSFAMKPMPASVAIGVQAARDRSDDGLEEATVACGRVFSSERAACSRTVERAYFFDRAAIGVCSNLSLSESYLNCFKAIADKEYLPEETAACSRGSFDDKKISCLRSAGRIAWSPSRPNDRGRDEAARLCGKLPYDSDKITCRHQVYHARYFERAAIGVCSELTFNGGVADCISAITDKTYSGDISACGRQSSDERKVSCLRSAGRPWGHPDVSPPYN